MAKKRKDREFYKFESKSKIVEYKNGNKREYKDEQGRTQTETITQLMYSMLMSAAWQDLTSRQRDLYLIAKTQFFAARSRPAKDYPEIDNLQGYNGRECFYLNKRLVTKVYKIYPESNDRDLVADRKALVEHGFIELVLQGESNKGRHFRSIYKYSDKWKEWKRDNKS